MIFLSVELKNNKLSAVLFQLIAHGRAFNANLYPLEAIARNIAKVASSNITFLET